MITTVNSTQTLLSVLKSAQSGDTILLEAGSYSGVNLKDLKFDGLVTIASKDPNDPAVLTGLSVSGSEGLKFSNLEFDLSSPYTVWNLNINGSKNIELNDVNVHGSLNDNPGDDQSGLLIRSSTDVRVINSEFHELDHGVSLLNSNGVRLEGNAFHDMRADGIIGAGTSNVHILDNTFTDFHPVAGDHPDAIQFFTRNTTASAHDITISGNLITRGDGAIIQGIFISDQVGNLPYQNLTITNNVVVGTMYNGIAVYNSNDLVLSGNTVAAYSDMKSWIYVAKSTGATVTDNEAMLVKYSEAIDLTQSGNIVIPRISDEGVQLINEWLQGHAIENPYPQSEQPQVPDSSVSLPDVPVEAVKPAPAPPPPAGALILVGGDGADRLTVGGKVDTRIEGGAGDDILTGGGGKNVLVGGAGNDILQIRDGDDLVQEDADGGWDAVYASVDYTLGANVESLKMFAGATSGTGNELDNNITGTASADKIYGLDGNDDLRGRDGDDTIYGGNGQDQLQGEAGNDSLDGGAGADTLLGAVGSDTLAGGDGNDRLDGGAGSDVLSGGAGADSFAFRPGDLGSADRITDFSSGEGDRILLAEIDSNSLTATNDKFAFIGKAAFSGKAGELRYDAADGDATVSGDLNGDRVADFQIHLTGVSTLTGADFML
jgi:parallel beta-helix repeat protein